MFHIFFLRENFGKSYKRHQIETYFNDCTGSKMDS